LTSRGGKGTKSRGNLQAFSGFSECTPTRSRAKRGAMPPAASRKSSRSLPQSRARPPAKPRTAPRESSRMPPAASVATVALLVASFPRWHPLARHGPKGRFGNFILCTPTGGGGHGRRAGGFYAGGCGREGATTGGGATRAARCCQTAGYTLYIYTAFPLGKEGTVTKMLWPKASASSIQCPTAAFGNFRRLHATITEAVAEGLCRSDRGGQSRRRIHSARGAPYRGGCGRRPLP
jgi:hypothetical protein